ncbi:MAG: restriction endonuclease subunit S [Euryarchaeota archaeon]|nr:restriction endonuclease subunit S [Euryarchaeota archaeon]
MKFTEKLVVEDYFIEKLPNLGWYIPTDEIECPPLPEQHRIAGILSAVDRKLELECRRKEKLERVKKGLMNELLTGRKRVNVENDGSIYK